MLGRLIQQVVNILNLSINDCTKGREPAPRKGMGQENGTL